MSNSDKLLLTQGGAAIKCQIIVKATGSLPQMVLSEQNSIKDWIYTDERYVPKQGFIGQFVARTLSGNLQNISDDFNIDGREIELRIGIVSSTGENWYSLGNFIVTDPTDNNVEDNTKFEAMDYTKLFNIKFNGDFKGTGFTQSYNEIITNKGSVTALWLAKYCCAQVGVEFGQTTFTNSDFVINQNPFQAGETCRDVLKEISKLAYSWVRIGWDNKCYIDFEPVSSNTVSTENIITNDHYYSLKTRKEQYGPINNVVIGMSGIDGESHSEKDATSISQNGEHAIYIYDNPLTNTFELRALAQRKASKLFGLQFAQVSTETIGHPWLQANEKINVVNMENVDNYTYPFNRTINFTGHIKTTIDSMVDSEVESTLAYESDILKNIKKASINVDKQNGVINMLVKDVEATKDAVENIDGTINPVGKVEGEEIYITDASDKPLMSFQIDGRSTQETRSGKNRFKAQGLSTPSSDTTFWNVAPNATIYTQKQDGWANINQSNLTTANTYYNIAMKSSALDIKPSTQYTYIIEFDNVTKNTSTDNVSRLALTQDGGGLFTSSRSIQLSSIESGRKYKFLFTTIDDLSTESLFYMYLNLYNNSISFDLRVMIVEGDYTNSDIEYELYGVSPSPDYPSEIKSVGYENLWGLSSTFTNDTDASKWVLADTDVSIPAGTYVFSCNLSGSTSCTFNYKYADNVNNHAGCTGAVVVTFKEEVKKVAILLNAKSSISNISLIEGDEVRPYIPYGKTGIEIVRYGKNYIPNTDKYAEYNIWAGTLDSENKLNDFPSVKTESAWSGPYVNLKKLMEESNLKVGDTVTYSIYFKTNFKPNRNMSFTAYRFTSASGNGNISVPMNTVEPGKWIRIKFTFTLTEYSLTANRARYETDYYDTSDAYYFGNNRENKVWFACPQLERGSEETEWESFKKQSTVHAIDEPLRSLPNGVKDIAYTKNNKLYVDRYVGSRIFDGTEAWAAEGSVDNLYRYYIKNLFTVGSRENAGMSNYFKYEVNYGGTEPHFYLNTSGTHYFFSNISTLSEFKTWLSTHNTQVDYELATPLTEEYELTEKPSTVKVVNNMYVDDETKPVLHVEYVRDTTISDYVEQHVSELTMSGNEIKASVSSLEGVVITNKSDVDKSVQGVLDKFDDYVPQSTYISLERSVIQLQTDTYTKTEINTKLTDGSVTKVVTTSGTFDENGMHYEKTNAKTKTTINEVGVSVRDATGSVSKSLLFAGYVDNDNTEFPQYKNQTIVGSDNIVVREFLVIGDNSRIQDYEDGGGIFIL